MSVETRLKRIERQLGVGRDEEMVELPLPDGRIARTTRRAFDGFVAWLKDRENYGKEAIETD